MCFLIFLNLSEVSVKWDVVLAEFGLDLVPHGVGESKERFLGDHVPLEKVPLVPTLYWEPAVQTKY